jgi:hypothetical protein
MIVQDVSAIESADRRNLPTKKGDKRLNMYLFGANAVKYELD